MQRWVEYVRAGALAEKLKDPAYLRALPANRNDRNLHPWRHICDYFGQLGSYVKYDLIDKASYLDVSSPLVFHLYEIIEPCIQTLRECSENDAIYEKFEYLAVQSALWMKSHPTSYPAGVPRFNALK